MGLGSWELEPCGRGVSMTTRREIQEMTDRLQLGLASEGAPLPILGVVGARVARVVAAQAVYVGAEARVLGLELPAEQLDLAVERDVFLFEFAHAGDGGRDGGELVRGDLQRVLQADDGLLELHDRPRSVDYIYGGTACAHLLDVRLPLGTVARLGLGWVARG